MQQIIKYFTGEVNTQKKAGDSTEYLRVAWLFPSMAQANYWHPVLSKFTRIFHQTIVYTGLWPGFTPGFNNAFKVETVGKTTFASLRNSSSGYNSGFILVSPSIIIHLIRFKPDIIFTNGFSLWTLLALVFKLWGKWRIVIVYDGSSPNIDYQGSKIRLLLRRVIAKAVDACITNSRGGKAYLTNILNVESNRVFARPYQVPSTEALLNNCKDIVPDDDSLTRPIFLFVGKLIARKGVHYLLQACTLLNQQGYCNYTVQIVGDGIEEKELKIFCKKNNLDQYIQWIGKVNYEQLYTYFQNADIFIFPTLEDIWGLVVLESMFFSKPVICSQWAGASEMVAHGENGYIIDPLEPKDIAMAMRHFIDEPALITSMGNKSKQFIAEHTPEAAVSFLSQVTSFVCKS